MSFVGEDHLVSEVERGGSEIALAGAYGGGAIPKAVDRLRGEFTRAVRAVFAAAGKTDEQVEQLVNAMLGGALRLSIQRLQADGADLADKIAKIEARPEPPARPALRIVQQPVHGGTMTSPANPDSETPPPETAARSEPPMFFAPTPAGFVDPLLPWPIPAPQEENP